MSFRTPGRFRGLAPLAAAGMAFAIVLAACGSSASPAPTPTPTPPPDPKAALVKSATSLTTLKAFHIDIELGGTVNNPNASAGGPASITFDGTKLSADVDITNQKGSVTLAIPAPLLALVLAASGTALPGASAIPAGDTADLIYVGDLYFKVPLLASTLGSDKWVKV